MGGFREEARSDYDIAALQDAATDSSIEFEQRDARALTQYLTVLPEHGRARDADGLYVVVSESGSSYLVDVRHGACECPDAEYRDPDGGCKHVRRVRYGTGERAIPAWVDPTAVNEYFSLHVGETPVVALTDGGVTTVDDADDTADGCDEQGDGRPDDCDCEGLSDLCCWPCWQAGFEKPPSRGGGIMSQPSPSQRTAVTRDDSHDDDQLPEVKHRVCSVSRLVRPTSPLAALHGRVSAVACPHATGRSWYLVINSSGVSPLVTATDLAEIFHM